MAKGKTRKHPGYEDYVGKKVKMVFTEDQYYNDVSRSKGPMYEKGKVYELEGAGWILRWLKRGGQIVEGSTPTTGSGAPATTPPPSPPLETTGPEKAPEPVPEPVKEPEVDSEEKGSELVADDKKEKNKSTKNK